MVDCPLVKHGTVITETENYTIDLVFHLYRQIPKYNECRWSPLPQILCRTFVSGDLPEHSTVTLPALSPTMESGTIIKWEKEEGEVLEEGDTIAQVETDKAVMDMETPSAGYLAKIIIPAGSKDLPLGKVRMDA